MIAVAFDDRCLSLMRVLRISPAIVEKAVNERHQGCVSDGLDRLIAAHWLDPEQLILVDSIVSKKTWLEKDRPVRFDEVIAKLALLLPSTLEHGRLDRTMTIEQILTVVAKSFGAPVRGHAAEPYALVYAGPWDGNLAVQAKGTGTYCCFASVDPATSKCELAWALDLDRYEAALPRGFLPHSKMTINALVAELAAHPARYPM